MILRIKMIRILEYLSFHNNRTNYVKYNKTKVNKLKIY